jgi:hypothetical protein
MRASCRKARNHHPNQRPTGFVPAFATGRVAAEAAVREAVADGAAAEEAVTAIEVKEGAVVAATATLTPETMPPPEGQVV